MTTGDAPRLHHVNFLTTRLDEMVDWYATVLGMEVVYRFPNGSRTTRPTTASP